MKPRTATVWVVSLAATVGGCAAPGPERVLVRATEVVDQTIIERILRRDPIPPDKPVHRSALLEGNEFSGYVYQIADRQPRHLHQHHDLTFVVYRGRGQIFIDDRRRHMAPGQFYHVPRGVPHYCVNTGSDPLVGIVLYSPALNGEDTVEVPRGAKSYERE
ncbi:MAG: cupin domain-containing protein [Planctomycetes bacterium]|nr:cupin domain-containing protein [Planctomycetota bacterium]